MLSSTPTTSGWPSGTNAATSRPSKILEPCRPDHAPRDRNRWNRLKPLSDAPSTARRAAQTVRWFRHSNAPVASATAFNQVGCVNSTANGASQVSIARAFPGCTIFATIGFPMRQTHGKLRSCLQNLQISAQAADYGDTTEQPGKPPKSRGQDMDHGVHGGSVACMLKPHLRLEDSEHGLDDEALAQHDLVAQHHQMVAHVAPDAGDQVPAALPEFGEHLTADIAFVDVELASQVPGDLVQHGAVGDVAGGDLQRHDLALVVDHDVQLEAEKPSRAGLTAVGEAVEDPVAVDAAIVADGALAWVGEVDAGLFAAEAVQQHHQGHKQPRHQADEAVIVRQIAKAGALPSRRRRDQLVGFPVGEQLAEIVETAIE